MVHDISVYYVLSMLIFFMFLIFPVVIQSHLLVKSEPKGTFRFIVMDTHGYVFCF